MKKKLFKYIKFFVSFTLILSLVAPSYASLGASDGSAFVTKAEFDSALADFNSRLTTFEAGINSKIDSQVTSYLDRNGIWSGKSQSWAGSDFVAVTGTVNEKSHTFHCYGNSVSNIFKDPLWDQSATTYSQADLRVRKRNAGIDNLIIINEINKSGLMYLVLNFSTGSSVANARKRCIDESLAASGETVLIRYTHVDQTATTDTHNVSANNTQNVTIDYAQSAKETIEMNFGLNSNKNKTMDDYKMTYVLAQAQSEFFTTWGVGFGIKALGTWPEGTTQEVQTIYFGIPIGFSDLKNQTFNMFVSKGQQLVMNIESYVATNSSSASGALQKNWTYPDDWSNASLRGKKGSVWEAQDRIAGYIAWGFEEIQVY